MKPLVKKLILSGVLTTFVLASSSSVFAQRFLTEAAREQAIQAQNADATQELRDPLVDDEIATARWFYQRKEYDMAIPMLQRIGRNHQISISQRAEALLLLANISQSRGDVSQALILLQNWLDQFPSHPKAPEVSFVVGRLYRDISAFGRAREHFYRTLSSLIVFNSRETEASDIERLESLSMAAKWELADTEYQESEWERALELFDRFKEQNPDAGSLIHSATFRQADCHYHLGQMGQAKMMYEKALGAEPLHPFATEAWLRLVDIYGKLQEFDKQKAALQSLIWLVEKVHPDQLAYWQQRVALVLMPSLESDQEQAQSLLATIHQDTASWGSTAKHLQEVVARQQVQPVSPSPSSPQSAEEANTESPQTTVSQENVGSQDPWSNWIKELEQNNQRLQQRLSALKSIDEG